MKTWNRSDCGVTLIGVVGGTEAQLAAHLLSELLAAAPRVRVGIISPDEACPDQLARMARQRCTHVILRLDEAALTRREWEGLHLSVTALVGPVRRPELLGELLKCSDMTVFNLDERFWVDYRSVIPKHAFSYSENREEADLFSKNLRLFPGHMEFEAVTVGHISRIHLPVPGGFALYHGLCALACGVCLGLDWALMARVLRSAHGPRGRLEVLSIPAAYTVVLDAAHTPRALERALVCAREFTAGRLICLLSCPEGTDERLGHVAGELADRLILTGDGGGPERALSAIGTVQAGTRDWDRPCAVEPDREAAIRRALEQAGPGDVILLTGPFDKRSEVTERERELVGTCIRQRNLRRTRTSLPRV